MALYYSIKKFSKLEKMFYKKLIHLSLKSKNIHQYLNSKLRKYRSLTYQIKTKNQNKFNY